MKAKIAAIVFVLIYQFCGMALCSDLVINYGSELKPKESDFTYENYRLSLTNVRASIERYKKNKRVSWEMEEIGIPNAQIRIEGYMLKLRKENARLKLENAILRRDRNALAEAGYNFKQIKRRIKKFLAEKRYVD
jgi:hypothetical protein